MSYSERTHQGYRYKFWRFACTKIEAKKEIAQLGKGKLYLLEKNKPGATFKYTIYVH
jgi:hypothetical protein